MALRARWFPAVLALGALQLPTSLARADPATAEALFSEGRQLLDAGRYAEACDKLAESQAQDPASGTLINLALCYEKLGKLASAWAHYRLAASLARRDAKPERAATAEAKVSELEPLLPRLTIHATQHLVDATVVWGTLKIGTAAFDSAIPVDPGEHRLQVSAPGFKPAELPVTVKPGESRIVELPELSRLDTPERAEAASAQLPAAATRPATTRTASDGDSTSAPSRPSGVALLVGGSGLALLGVGAFFGVSALSSYSDAKQACPSRRDCEPGALEERQSAEQRAWLANIALGAGVLATGAGVYLWLSQRSRASVSANVSGSQRGAGVTLRARF